MSKANIQQWLEANGHKELKPVSKKQIKIYEYEGFVLESWIHLDVPPISKRDAFYRHRFVFQSGEEQETPLFREYKAQLTMLLPEITEEQKNYMSNNEFIFKVIFEVDKTNGDYNVNGFGLVDPFIRVLKAKYGFRNAMINGVETKKVTGIAKISFMLVKCA